MTWADTLPVVPLFLVVQQTAKKYARYINSAVIITCLILFF
jgi:hypothetical protein